MGPTSIPSKLFMINPMDAGEGSSAGGGGGQSAEGNSGSNPKTTHAHAIHTPSAELDDAKLDNMFGKPNKDHLKIARDKILGQSKEINRKDKPSIYSLEYSPHLVLTSQDTNAVARQLLGLHKSYVTHFYQATQMSRVLLPSANGKKHKAVTCSKRTLSDLDTTSTED